MNPDNNTPRPNGPAADPLLAALRQQLADYGQAPPANAWASIRQHLPVPLRPWWRRPRRLLPLLALLLMVGSAAWWRTTGFKLSIFGTKANQKQQVVSRKSHTNLAQALHDGQATQATPTKTATTAAVINRKNSVNQTLAKPATATTEAQAALRTTHAEKGTEATGKPRDNRAAVLNTVKTGTTAALETAGETPPRRKKKAVALLPGWPDNGSRGARSVEIHGAMAAVTARQKSARLSQPGQLPETAKTHAAKASTLKGANSASKAAGAVTKFSRHFVGLPASFSLDNDSIRAVLAVKSTGQNLTFGLLKFRPVALLLGAKPALPVLAARPDSTRPPLPLARRWALQLMAGPALSYRRLAAAPPVAGRPNTAPLERPALGFGAQVQVRRVLTGRWALAGGLGYHEYATELMLRVLPAPGADSAARAVWQRDSYRLLTVPVQLGYALGVPRSSWQAAVLAGAEAGFYLSGRSTEGSACDCQQLAYPNAAASPYRPWSLALSLGLDFRYRLGHSRWQWLVQPTGRYVLSPFVRARTSGFAPRQPFSLGVLTGFSWDVR